MTSVDELIAEAQAAAEAALQSDVTTLAKADSSAEGKKLDADVQELADAQEESDEANDEQQDDDADADDAEQEGNDPPGSDPDPEKDGEQFAKAYPDGELIPVDATEILQGIFNQMERQSQEIAALRAEQATLAKAVQASAQGVILNARTNAQLAKAVQDFGSAPARPKTARVPSGITPSNPATVQASDAQAYTALLAKAEQYVGRGITATDIGTMNAVWNDTKSMQDVLDTVPNLARLPRQ